jgi:hypothetical protein
MIAVKKKKPSAGLKLEGVLRNAGKYFQPADLFYQRLWWQRLRQVGFQVISVERLEAHPVWDIRLRGTLAAQAYLLVSKPASHKVMASDEMLEAQLKAEVQRIAQEMGPAIKTDSISVDRNGQYLRVAFLWSPGKPGLLMRKTKKPEAFTFLIRPWLRQVRN